MLFLLITSEFVQGRSVLEQELWGGLVTEF